MTTHKASRNTPDRMELPFVGLATFARQPACPDWDKLDGADVAILGVPIDTASSYRVGTRFGPRAIREVSMFHGFGSEGVFDFEDEGHGSPMRRVSEMPHVKAITTLGPHNMAAVNRKDWEAAKAYGTHVVPLRKLRAQGAAASLAHIPDGERVYVSIDIDSFDPSIAPGSATISHGDLSYYEGKELLREVARRFVVVGADSVEVSPPYDPSGITSLLAARTSLDFIGSIFHERAKRRR
jgi:arginase family enzyme